MPKSPNRVVSQYTGRELSVRDPDIEYEAGLEEGFRVTSAKSYITTVDDKPKHQVALQMDTPYYYGGRPVSAYVVVDVSETDRTNDAAAMRSFNTAELWVDGQNIEDIHASKNSGEQLYVDTPYGLAMHGDALDQVGVFGQAASFNEHVMEYDEYKEVFDAYHEGKADEAMYAAYLDRSKRLLKDGMQYIGAVQTEQDIDLLDTTTPSFQEEVRADYEERWREEIAHMEEEFGDDDGPDL